jgi:glycerol-3-phosphate dehydrogenase
VIIRDNDNFARCTLSITDQSAFSTAAGRRITCARESSIVADDAQQPYALAVFGGKITSYCVIAAKVLQMCKLTLEKRGGIADTARLKLEA